MAEGRTVDTDEERHQYEGTGYENHKTVYATETRRKQKDRQVGRGAVVRREACRVQPAGRGRDARTLARPRAPTVLDSLYGECTRTPKNGNNEESSDGSHRRQYVYIQEEEEGGGWWHTPSMSALYWETACACASTAKQACRTGLTGKSPTAAKSKGKRWNAGQMSLFHPGAPAANGRLVGAQQ